ncbi:MAG: patatin-like phospholipase family protein [Clostridia bacterium]|nr:patatin-like phospholipase family protein [Clostridia bacterium]
MKYALALAGGGTKGSYQIGVWKALRELGIEITAVSGTSIGAINGAAIALGEYEKARRIWENLDYSMVFDYTKIKSGQELHEKYESIKEQLKDIAKKRGLDITPLRKLLNDAIDEEKLRSSPIDLIIATVSLSEFKPVYKSTSEIPRGQVVDYILASAALPIFERIKIDGNTYLDGGAYDLLPINTLIARGHRNIIAVDLAGGMGIKRRIKDKNVNIISIKNSETIGGILEFDPRLARANVRLGYLDAMKAFGKNYGKRYYIVDSDRPKYMYALTHDEMKLIFDEITNEKPKSEKSRIMLKHLFRTLRKYTDESLNPENAVIAAAEIAAETFEIKRVREYSDEALVKKIMKTHRSVMKGIISETHRIDRLKIRLSSLLIKDDEFPGVLLLMTLPKIFITNIFIFIMKKRMAKQ